MRLPCLRIALEASQASVPERPEKTSPRRVAGPGSFAEGRIDRTGGHSVAVGLARSGSLWSLSFSRDSV